MTRRARRSVPSPRVIGVIGLILAAAIGLSAASAQTSAVAVQSFSDRIQFQAEGDEVEQVQLEVFNLSGQVAYQSDWASGRSLSWNLRTETGRDVANGVYLYVVRTEDAQGNVDQSIGKLAVLDGKLRNVDRSPGQTPNSTQPGSESEGQLRAQAQTFNEPIEVNTSKKFGFRLNMSGGNSGRFRIAHDGNAGFNLVKGAASNPKQVFAFAVFESGSDNLFTIWNNTKGALAMGIDGDNNVGIGTDSPSEKFHVSGGDARITTSTTTELFLENTSASQTWSLNTFSTGDFVLFNDTQGGDALRVDPSNNNVGIGQDNPEERLHVGGRMKVTGTGSPSQAKLLLESTNEPQRWSINTLPLGDFVIFNETSGSTSGAFRINDFNGNVGIGSDTDPSALLTVGESGDGTHALANSWDTFSDRRLKTNIATIQAPLKKLNHINGYTFDWKGKEGDARQLGVLAQEVEDVLPQLVSKANPGHKYLSYDELIPLLIEASQAQQDQLEQLKATNDQLVERLEVKQQATNQLQSQMRSMMDRIKELEAQVEDE